MRLNHAASGRIKPVSSQPPIRIHLSMDPDSKIRELCQVVLRQPWVPREQNPVYFHTLRKRELAAPASSSQDGFFGRVVSQIKSLMSNQAVDESSNVTPTAEMHDRAPASPPAEMIDSRATVTIACPRPDYDALKRADDAYVKTLTFWQRLMRPRPFWDRQRD